ncbi:hypothetical protein I317_05025 [Kwoniella heveanensis CBS 569]|nr:hypothetical protein I317_05025 [Kwoniella heveanensis CBS 569]
MSAITTFPSTSSHFLDLNADRYEVDQLLKAVEGAIEDEGKAEPSNNPVSPSPNHVHFHTCTIESSLHPPEPLLHYWGQPDRPNEAYDTFTDIRQKVAAAVEPFTPLTLASPSSDVVRPGFVYSGHPFSGITIYSPKAHRRKHLARLHKSLPNSLREEWAPGTRAWDMENWLHAILALDPSVDPTRKAGYRDDKKRFSLLSGLQISWIPDAEGESAGVDLKLSITIHVFVNMETIFVPLPETGNDMLGLVLHSLIPSPTAATFYNASESRATALRHFYAALKPAPDLPFNYSANNMQPKEMVSRLLPFQTRTVHKLLQREKSHNVQLEPARTASDPPGFWKAYNFGLKEGRVAYRRVTGDLVPTGSGTVTIDRKGKGRAPEGSPERDMDDLLAKERDVLPVLLDLGSVSGTMLCEEMGLGKTLEAIALVLLHRHPLSKSRITPTPLANGDSSSNSQSASGQKAVPVIDLLKGTPGMDDPYIKQWIEDEQAAFTDRRAYDEQAQLHVTEVATTLIVTPPSLLKQWVAEMQRHAPTLRVCVYEGWKSLQKGVDKQRAARLKVQGAKAEATRKRKAEQLRNQTRAKYARKFDGTRVKSELEDAEDVAVADVKDEESVDEEGTLQVTQRQFVEYVRAHDVVVTTYQDHLKVALPAPPRSRRSTANYKPNERPRSPLVMVEWWRVIMDEVQLHGDSTDAANMVSLIPRKHGLAVSGTPAKADIKDLMGSLKFLRVPVLPHDNRLWHRLQQPGMRQAFEGLFSSIAIRTTKKEVSGEFNLPRQTRFVVPIELSEIELHYYNDTLDRFRDQLHLPHDFRDARPYGWVLDRQLFFACLRNLRQVCTHIQVGQLHAGIARGDRRLHLGRTILSMTEALEKIRNDHSQEFLIDSREQMKLMVRKAQLSITNEVDDVRYLTALNLYEKVRTTATSQLERLREHLKTLLGGQEDVIDLEREATPDRAQSQQEREKTLAISAARHTIRDVSIILHQVWFFEGDVRHILKEQEAEIHCYAEADTIRKEILQQPLKRANLSVQILEKAMTSQGGIQDVSDLQTEEVNHRGGLLSSNIVAQVNDLLEILNDNAYLVFEWRAKLLALLSSPIEAENTEDASGQSTEVQNPEAEYYAEALKAQGEVEAYLIAFAAAVADRQEFLVENRSLLASHDAREKKQRATKAAINAMAGDQNPDVPDELKEQVKVLMEERQALRQARIDKECERPLKGYQIDLRAIANGPNRPEEILLCTEMAGWLKRYIHKQAECIESLNKELDMFRATFNRRVVYFAALQEISDSVSADVYHRLAKDVETASAEITALEVKLARMVVKGRYLQYLGNKQEGEQDIREDCIICFGSSDDNKAVLLQCGHYFCKSCFEEFRKSQMGRKCPSCRTEIDPKQVTQVRLNAARKDMSGSTDQTKIEKLDDESQEMEIPDLTSAEAEQERRKTDLSKLKMLDDEKRRDISDMDLLGEFGSKASINFLIKHLMYYRSKEPETRHVIFSNWSDSLNIVMQALEQNNIKFTSFESGRKQKDVVDTFLKDESISVFLLHAERESSGLTLTTCRVVHLLEPVLSHSFELQAIGRVDRLGQDKETTVYCYATMETVESRILSQGVRNGTSIYLADEDADGVVADMPNVASAAHKGGDVSLGGDANEEDLLGLIL